MEQIVQFVSIIAALSVTAERALEIAKTSMNLDNLIPERYRKAAYQIAPALLGSAIYLGEGFQAPMLESFAEPVAAGIVGLLVAGGSSFWYSVLKAMSALKPSK